MNDLESRVATSLHRAADAEALGEPDFANVVARTRRLRARRRAIASSLAVVILAAVGFVALREKDGSTGRIRTGGTATTVAPNIEPGRPVLDACKTTRAMQSVVVGGSADPKVNQPVSEEVFADPARGLSGPLVVFDRGSGAKLATGDGVAGGGKIANAQVNGRDADVEFWGTHGGMVWDASSGGGSNLWEQGLTEDEMRTVAEQLDAGTNALPQGLVSLGKIDRASVSISYCYDEHGQSASITEVRGDQASRYREAFFAAPASARRFDNGNTTFVIDGGGGTFDVANATYHEATPDEWDLICLGAGSTCGENAVSASSP